MSEIDLNGVKSCLSMCSFITGSLILEFVVSIHLHSVYYHKYKLNLNIFSLMADDNFIVYVQQNAGNQIF